MDNQYTYLTINFLTVIFPILLSFDKRVRYVNNWKHVLPASAISGLVFLVWDHIFTICQVWSFNADYVIGLYILDLPIEEILFFITVPFACIFIYECLNYYVRKDVLKSFSTAISAILMAISIIMLIILYNRVYSLVTFGLLLVLSLWLIWKRPQYLGRFYLAFIISLLPFYIVNGFLTSIPVVSYNDLQNCGIRIGTIPLEDHFYSLAMLLLNVMLFEYFRRKSRS